jgi:hypothetical protein
MKCSLRILPFLIAFMVCVICPSARGLTPLDMEWELGDLIMPDHSYDPGSNTTVIGAIVPYDPLPSSFSADFSGDSHSFVITISAPAGKRFAVVASDDPIQVTVGEWFSALEAPEWPTVAEGSCLAAFGGQTTGTPSSLTGNFTRTSSGKDIFWRAQGSGTSAFSFTEITLTGSLPAFGTAGMQTYDSAGGMLSFRMTLPGNQPAQDLVTLEDIPEPSMALWVGSLGAWCAVARRRPRTMCGMK